MKNLDQYWNNLIEYGIVTDNEIQLVTTINGWNEKTFNDILFVRTGYRDWEQFVECEIEEE